MTTRRKRSVDATIAYKGQTYAIAERTELKIGGRVPWAIQVEGGWYFLAFDDEDFAAHRARDYVRTTLRSSRTPHVPSRLARMSYPLLLSIDNVTVKAWTQLVSRFFHPVIRRWTGTERGPVWFFESERRSRTDCGTATPEQTIDDVRDLATIWLRSE